MDRQVTPYIQSLIDQGLRSVGAQYEKHSSASEGAVFQSDDPLGEEERYSPTKGLVHKFGNRALWKLSYRCAAHCQFCTRHRQIGKPYGDLTDADIESALQYLSDHREIDDVILSGGDPFFTPRVTEAILNRLSALPTIKVVRIGTRLPVQSPASFDSTPIKSLLSTIKEFRKRKALFVQLHINHVTELTDAARSALALIIASSALVVSQTVFLKGINDSVEALGALFRELYYLGIVPYYLYRCDYVKGLEQYACGLEDEVNIVSRLTMELSGLAMPTYIVDVAGRGKIPVPLNFWSGSISTCRDFDGKEVTL